MAVAAAALAPCRSKAVTAFTKAALAEGLTRSAAKLRAPGEMLGALDAESLIAWAQEHDLTAIIMPYAPVGPVRDRLDAIAPALTAAGIALVPVRRVWDSAAWPHAGKGFFAFKDKIPGLISG